MRSDWQAVPLAQLVVQVWVLLSLVVASLPPVGRLRPTMRWLRHWQLLGQFFRAKAFDNDPSSLVPVLFQHLLA